MTYTTTSNLGQLNIMTFQSSLQRPKKPKKSGKKAMNLKVWNVFRAGKSITITKNTCTRMIHLCKLYIYSHLTKCHLKIGSDMLRALHNSTRIIKKKKQTISVVPQRSHRLTSLLEIPVPAILKKKIEKSIQSICT